MWERVIIMHIRRVSEYRLALAGPIASLHIHKVHNHVHDVN